MKEEPNLYHFLVVTWLCFSQYSAFVNELKKKFDRTPFAVKFLLLLLSYSKISTILIVQNKEGKIKFVIAIWGSNSSYDFDKFLSENIGISGARM